MILIAKNRDINHLLYFTLLYFLTGEDDPADLDRPGWHLYIMMWQLGIELHDVPELAIDCIVEGNDSRRYAPDNVEMPFHVTKTPVKCQLTY